MTRITGFLAALSGIAGAAMLFLSFSFTTLYAQEEGPQGFYDIKELARLIEIARESGFSDEEIKQITVEDGERVINAWEFLQAEKRRRELEEKLAREQAEKRFLTVPDLFDDLDKKDEADLKKIRDESIFVD